MRLLRPFVNQKDEFVGYNVKCPGCDTWHSVYTVANQYNKAIWGFDGNMDKPTFSPSLLVTWTHGEEHEKRRCHSFIRNGEWQFLSDCTHDLAGQTIPMVEI